MPFVAALGVAIVNMPRYVLGVFFAPLQQEFGWSRAEIASGILAFSCVAVFSVPLMGRLIDLKGPRRIVLPGVVLFSLTFAAFGLAKQALWTWWAVWIILACVVAWASPVAWTVAVASRFDKARGLAMAVTLSGAGIGTIVAPLLANFLIGEYGWRVAYVAMGAIFCAVLLPLSYFFFFGAADLPQNSEGHAVDKQAPILHGLTFREGLSNSKFIRLVLATLIIASVLFALVVHFVPIVIAAGLSTDRAAEAAAVIGIGSIAGRLLCGYLLDHMPATIAGFVAFSLPAPVALLIFYFGADEQIIFGLAFVLGLSLGSEIDVIGYIASRLVGLRNYGSLFGICVSAMALGVGFGPWIGGLIYDHWGSYEYLLFGAAPLCLIAAALVLSLGTKRTF